MATDNRGRKLPKGIRQRNDIFEGRFMINGKSHSVKGKTVKETLAAMDEKKHKIRAGIYADCKGITYDSWFDIWINEYKMPTVKTGTITTYRELYNAQIKKALGNMKLSNIRPEHIQKLCNDMAADGKSASTIEMALAILNGSLKRAKVNRLIEINPASDVYKPKAKPKKEKMALTRDQQALFMQYAKGSYLYNLFYVILRTGMRSGEIRGLKWSDIDTKKKQIHINRTLKYENGKGYYTDAPKTEKSKRTIPATDEVIKALEAQRKFWGFKIEPLREERFLFCNENGDPLDHQRIDSEIKRITKAINADCYDFPYITSHVFRHTFATRAAEEGIDYNVLKEIMGHTSLSMTMDIYSHVMDDRKTKSMEMIASAF